MAVAPRLPAAQNRETRARSQERDVTTTIRNPPPIAKPGTDM